MHSGRTHQKIEELAGTQLDKLSEVILLQAANDSECALRLSDIAGRLGVELSSVSRKVHKLEVAGFVGRVNDPNDGRAWRLQITEAGSHAVGELARARARLASDALATWSDGERHQLVELLEHFATDLCRQLGEKSHD